MPLVSQATLELYFRPRNVKEVFTDDGGQVAGPRLAAALQVGSDQASAKLSKVPAWQEEEAQQELVDGDTSLQFAVCQLVMAVGHEGKPEWSAEDRDVSSRLRKQAFEAIDNFATENTVHHPRTANARQFEFARRRGNDTSGGF